jgi:hypothetical protein
VLEGITAEYRRRFATGKKKKEEKEYQRPFI